MSETTNLKLFKHDNPSTNENQFNVDKSLNQNWDKLDDFAGDAKEQIILIEDEIGKQTKSLEQLQENNEQQDKDIENLQTELETEIQELEQDIQANSIIEETEQAKSLYIDDASGARGSLSVEGNSEQDGEASPQHPSEIKVLEAGSTEIKKIAKNIMPILNLGNNWEYTEKGIRNLKANVGNTITRINLKKGQTIKIGFKIFTKPTSSSTFTGYIDGKENSNLMFNGINSFTVNRLYTKTYTATEDCKLTYTLWGNANSETFEFQMWAELNTLTDYEQYKEETYNLDIQQEMLIDDKFDLNTKKEIHNWKKIIFKGTEQWYFYSGSTAPFGIYISDLVLPASQQDIPEVICTQYKACKWAEVSTSGDYLVSNSGGANFLRFRDIDCSTLDEFKARLAEKYSNGTPVELWYKSTQKTELDLTEAQIEVLEKLNKLRFYKGINNIFTTEDIALLQAKYSVDIQTKLNNINTQLLNLGGNQHV